MKRLHTFQLWEGPQAEMFFGLLAQEGVECVVKNARLYSVVGEIPFIECLPELWVIDDEVAPRARLLLDGWLQQKADCQVQPWTCPNCGENSDGLFELCWNCMTERP